MNLRRHWPAAIVLPVALGLASSAWAGSRDTAKRIHDRLTGVPPKANVLDQMTGLVEQGKLEQAARLAMQNDYFYNLGLKNWFSTWTNQEESFDVPLNDFTATLIGAVRDDISFDRVLYDDIVYVGNAGGANYSPTSNQHYEDLESNRESLADVLEMRTQSSLNGLGETAGVMTTRAFGEAYYTAGTNRRAVRFTFMNFACRDMEEMSDTTTPDFRVRQDVDRSPGGDSKVFRNRCSGCHGGMDGLAGAFAHVDFDNGGVVYNGGSVRSKFFNNANIFPDGFQTSDDSWVNLWTVGQNASIGWNGQSEGRGLESYGRMLANTDAFPNCMAKRVWQKVCLEEIDLDDERLSGLAQDFKSNNYSMQTLFAKTAASCLAK